MRKTLAIVGLGLIAASSGLPACRASDKAGIVLNVTTAENVDRAAVRELQVAVNGNTQSYAVGSVATWSLGIETGAGSKSITVRGMGEGGPVTNPWQGTVNAQAGKVVNQNVELWALDSPPPDAGAGGSPGTDGAAIDVRGSGGAPGSGGTIIVSSGGVAGTGGVLATGGTGNAATGGTATGGAAAGGASGACNQKVLLLGDKSTDTNTGIQAALQTLGLTVTLVQNGVADYVGTPASKDFSVVVVMGGQTTMDGADMPAAGQSAIVDANASGVGVVFTDPAGYARHPSYWAQLKMLALITFGTGQANLVPTYTLTADGHPLWVGLPPAFTSAVTVGVNAGGSLTNGGAAIATLVSQGGTCGSRAPTCIGVAVKDAPGRIVHDGTFFNYNVPTWYTDTNLFTLFANSIKWAARCL